MTIATPRTMKFVIGKTFIGNHPVPIIFPEEIPHAIMAVAAEKAGLKVASSGYLDKVPPIRAYGQWEWKIVHKGSMSSAYLPRDGDEMILRLFLEFGLSGEQLSVMIDLERQRNRG